MDWKQYVIKRRKDGNYIITLLPSLANDKPVDIEMTKDAVLEFANMLIKTVDEFEQKHHPEA